MNTSVTQSRTMLDNTRLSESRAVTVNLLARRLTESVPKVGTVTNTPSNVTSFFGSEFMLSKEPRAYGILADIAGLPLSKGWRLTYAERVPRVQTVRNPQLRTETTQMSMVIDAGWLNVATAEPPGIADAIVFIDSIPADVAPLRGTYIIETLHHNLGEADEELVDWDYSIVGLKPAEVHMARARFVPMGPYNPEVVEDPYD